MLGLRDKLTIKLFDGVNYTTVSSALADFMRDTEDVDTATYTHIYVGYYKPIASLYIDLSTTASVVGTLTIEYYNHDGWTAVPKLLDETRGLYRSGFVQWDRSLLDIPTLSTNDSDELHWVRLSIDTEQSLVIGGISLLFCDERDLQSEDINISSSEYLRGNSDQMPALLAARDDLLSALRHKGLFVVDASGYYQGLNPWDILELGQVRTAAKYLALSKIYSHLSDSDDDTWNSKADMYYSLYQNEIKNVQVVAVDRDNDGDKDIVEANNKFRTKYLRR